MKTAPQVINVSLGDRSYPILVGHGLLGQLDLFLTRHLGSRPRFFVIDENFERCFPSLLAQGLNDIIMSFPACRIPSGESSKSLAELARLWDFLATHHAGRDGVLIAVGGGVVGDLAGFAAATYTRGISFVQIPTTLLAQVDSSVGGKVGINLTQGKNLVGAFWQPSLVIADTDALRTLPAREISSGLAEVVKYGIIADPQFFSYLEVNAPSIFQRQSSALVHVVSRCCEIKASVVGEDERELTGRRAILNYGHTFGHALEATMGYGALLHGEAISIGMDCAARLAFRLGLVDERFVSRQRLLLEAFGLPVQLPADAPNSRALLAAMRLDKKAEFGKQRFILPTALGNVQLVSGVDETIVHEILEERI